MTNETVHCPKCHQPPTRVGQFWVCPEHGQISQEKPFTALRLFLSYGHDANEELVRRIKSDLEKRGHDVWFDKSEIKAGDDWRRAITDGITGSHKFVSFLSKHSTRDPGVCLDEVAIAIGVKGGNIQTILVESETEVKPPASISHIQWLDMHDWKERRAAGEAAWEEWYQAKLAEIVRVVESDESRRFAGEIERLSGHLKPIPSDSRIAVLLRKGFVGRTWLIEAIDDWRSEADRASRLFWITGNPGVGKSAFAAHLTHFGRDKVIAAQFVEWDKPDHQNAQRVVRSLAFQLATRLPDYRKLLLTLPEIAELDRKDPAELFDYLLANPLRSVIGGGRERYLIVIDALDEAGEAGRNPLVEMLARSAPRLPDWIGLVVTSRPESAVKTPLQGLNPVVLDTRTEANRADIRQYLSHELAPQLKGHPDADQLVEQILEKSEGVFLYVEHFCDDVHQNRLSLDHPEQFPQGLSGVIFEYFMRQFPDEWEYHGQVQTALSTIIAACEPLPIQVLGDLLQLSVQDLHAFLQSLGALFPVTGGSGGHESVKPYHKALSDWLSDKSRSGRFYVNVLDGHARLADIGWVQLQSNPSRLPSYLSAHLLYHQQAVGRWEQVEATLLNPGFRRTKIQVSSAGQLSDEFRGILAQWPAEQPGALRSVALLAATLARHLAENEHEEPNTLARCIQNGDYRQAARKAAQSGGPSSLVAALGLRALVEGQVSEGLAAFELAFQDLDADACAVLGLSWQLIPKQAAQVLERLLDVHAKASARVELITGVLYHGGAAVVRDVLRICLDLAPSWNDANLVAYIARVALPYAAEAPSGELQDLLLDLVSQIIDQRLMCELLSELSITMIVEALKPSESFASRFATLARRQIVEDAWAVLPHAAFLVGMSGRAAEALELLNDAEMHLRAVRTPLLVQRMALALNLAMEQFDVPAKAVCERMLGALGDLQKLDQAAIYMFRFCTDKAASQPAADDILTQAIHSAEAFTTPGELMRFVQLAGRLLARLRVESRVSVIDRLLPLLKVFAGRQDLSAQAVCHLAAALPADSEQRTNTLRDILEDLPIDVAATVLREVRSAAPVLAAHLANQSAGLSCTRLDAAGKSSLFEKASPSGFVYFAYAAALAEAAPEVIRRLLQATNARLHGPDGSAGQASELFGLRVVLNCGTGDFDAATDLTHYPRPRDSQSTLFLPASCSRLLVKLPQSNWEQFTAATEASLLTPRANERERLRQLRACAWLKSQTSRHFKARFAALVPGEFDLSREHADLRMAAAPLAGMLLGAGQAGLAKNLVETILKHLRRDGLEHLQLEKQLAGERCEQTLQLWHEALMKEFRAVPLGVPSARVLVAACRLLAAVPPQSKSLQIDQLFFNFAQRFFMFPAGCATAAALAHASLGLTRVIQIEDAKGTWTELLSKFSWELRQSRYERTTRSEMFALAAADLCATGQVVNARELIKLAIKSLPDASPAERGFGAIRDALAVMSPRCNCDSLADALLEAALAATQRAFEDQIMGVAAEAEILMNRPDHADRLLELIRTPSHYQAIVSRLALLEYFFSPQRGASRLDKLDDTLHARQVAREVLLTAGLPAVPQAYCALISKVLTDIEGLDALIAGCLARDDWNLEDAGELARLLQPASRPIDPNPRF